MKMLPPFPPSPPLGPPRGTYFSRRKLTQPRPPSPARTTTRAVSTNISDVGLRMADGQSEIRHSQSAMGLAGGGDGDETIAAALFDLHDAAHLGEQGVVTADADVLPGLEPRAPLPDDDAPPGHRLTGEGLHSQAAARAVPAVPRTAHTLLVCHAMPPREVPGIQDTQHAPRRLLRDDLRDSELRQLLAMPGLAAVFLALLELEDVDLLTPGLGYDLGNHLDTG